ncbi:hypothetical protein [Rhodococcus pyridinivorans]|uniref:hypothetical protein n=1 Tax=Rhodococcus pyridinivorans TaxID=103816 RepID=UPI003AAF61AD
MTSILVGIALPLALVLIAAWRAYRYRGLRETWILTAALGLLGSAKLARVPVITDEYIDEGLHAITGVYNLTDFTGMLLGTLAATTFAAFASFTIGGNWSTSRRLPYFYAVVTALMAGTFLMTPVTESPTSYMTADFPMTGWLAAYWTVYLGTIGVAALSILVVTVNAMRKVRRGPLAAGLATFAVGATIAAAYVAMKIADLYVNNDPDLDETWYAQHSKTVSLVLVLGLVATFAIVGGIVIAETFPRRYRRYQLLRNRMHEWQEATRLNEGVVLTPTEPTLTRWAAWRASKDSVAAHRLMVELSDIGMFGAAQAAPETSALQTPTGQ